jgi:hydroxymethylpyrimidine/phosphomethylpyrimidine kinase
MKAKSILTIAGLDTCGGAGLHADIKTIRSLGFHPCSVITAITFQNTCKISGLMPISQDVIEKQLLAVFDDLNIAGIKIGIVCNSEPFARIEGIYVPKVLDPVLKASIGFEFASKDVYGHLAKLCDVLTPNAEEAMVLSGISIKSIEDAKAAAKRIAFKFKCSVVVTGGMLEGKDVIFNAELGRFEIVEGELLDFDVHGTGCVYSSALTCYLAKGLNLADSCAKARDFAEKALRNAKIIGKCMPVVDPSPSCRL